MAERAKGVKKNPGEKVKGAAGRDGRENGKIRWLVDEVGLRETGPKGVEFMASRL